ncbi:MAG: hypothetical protein QM687_10720 [Ferruginibacter sp.]
MENLLSSYLYQYRTCPLPDVGVLVLDPGTAKASQADKIMLAPVPSIRLEQKEVNPESLLQWMGTVNGLNAQQAADALQQFCNRLIQLQPDQQHAFSNAGFFSRQESGEIIFQPTVIPTAFLPEVPAERVIHPDATHSMLVGDTETDTGTMTDILFAEEKKKKLSWGWWAGGLAVAALAAIAFYYMSAPGSGFGSHQTMQPAVAPDSVYSTGSK